jgi:RPA family protein
MKTLKYITLAFAGLLMASCMGDSYADPQGETSPFGNQEITETNVITIAQLKEQFAKEISTDYRDGDSYRQVTDDIKIKGIVTSSDEAGNIYNEIALQDETGAVIIAVAQGGIYGFLPVGTEVLVDLKDLYVGNYGLQAEIGVPTTNASGSTYVGRMSRATWDKHYKILSTGNTVTPEVFANGAQPTTWDLNKDGGKLGVLRNVTPLFWSRDSTYANANAGAGSKSWYFVEQGTNVMLYNSNFADFANAVVPNAKLNVTGIIKRYNNSWEIIIRSLADVEVVTDPYANIAGTGQGTEESPYDVTRALSLVANGANEADKNVYISGIISRVTEVSTQYHNATYYISTDGTANNELQVFRGKYLDGADFTAADQIKAGQKVTLVGKLIDYNGTPEVGANNKITSLE